MTLYSSPCQRAQFASSSDGSGPPCAHRLQVSQHVRRCVNRHTADVRVGAALPSDLHRRFPCMHHLRLVAVHDHMVEAWLQPKGPRGGSGAAAAAPKGSSVSPADAVAAARARPHHHRVCLPGMRVLDVSLSGGITPRGMRVLIASMPRLERLVAARCADTASLLDLHTLSRLHTLQLGDAQLDSYSVTDKSLAVVAGVHSLTSLCLQRCVAVTDAGIAALAALPCLEHLRVAGCKQLTGGGLSGLTRLTALDAGGCRQLGDTALHAAMPALTRLAILTLEGCCVTNAGLAALPQVRFCFSFCVCVCEGWGQSAASCACFLSHRVALLDAVVVVHLVRACAVEGAA